MPLYTWSIRWGNPYTHLPDGRPDVLMSVTRDASSGAETPQEISEAYSIGTGYAIFCCLAEPSAPKRRLSPAARQKLRRTRLRRRLEKRAPLYAAELYAEELRAHPDYYGTGEAQGTDASDPSH